MKEYFYNNKMWCESKYPEMQKACKLLASEEMKHLACIAVIFMIMNALFNLARPPVKRAYNYIKKKVINTFKRKQPMPKVPQPCVLKVDTKVDTEKWILQARLYIEPVEEHKRNDMLMIWSLHGPQCCQRRKVFLILGPSRFAYVRGRTG